MSHLTLPLICGAEHSADAGMMSCVFVLSFSTLHRFSAPDATVSGKAVARTRGETPKRNACATSVATGWEDVVYWYLIQ